MYTYGFLHYSMGWITVPWLSTLDVNELRVSVARRSLSSPGKESVVQIILRHNDQESSLSHVCVQSVYKLQNSSDDYVMPLFGEWRVL